MGFQGFCWGTAWAVRFAAAAQIKAASAPRKCAMSSGCSPEEQEASPKLWIFWRGSQNLGTGGRTGVVQRQISSTACSRTPSNGSSLHLDLGNRQTQTASPSGSQALVRTPGKPTQQASRAGDAGRPTPTQWPPNSMCAQGTEPPLLP